MLAASFAFMPGMCVTAIASVPYGDPELLGGITSCETFYGVQVPTEEDFAVSDGQCCHRLSTGGGDAGG